MAEKKKRKSFTIEDKMKIVDRLSRGEKNSNLAVKFEVAHSTIATIWKDKEKIRNHFLGSENSVSVKKIRQANNDNVEKALLVWFKTQRSHDVPINGPILQLKATELAKKMGMQNFNCSVGYIQRWRKRHSIVWGKISGEAGSVPANVCADWLNKVWPKIREGYNDDEIYNADETGLFFKMTPDKTMKFKGEKCSGGKIPKDRLTVLVAANMSGSDKKKLLIIGKAKNPRCFKNVKSLPVIYENNSNAWMTSEIFERHLRKWDRELFSKKKKILLLVDNCKAHPHLENLKSIKLMFLPPNTTAVLQPMDQGVINALKTHFRKVQVLRILQDIEDGKGVIQLNVLDAITMVSQAWDHVSQQTIAHCFAHAGFSSIEEFDEDDDLPLSELRKNLVDLSSDNILFEDWVQKLDTTQNIATQEDWRNIVSVDEFVETEGDLDDDQIVDAILDDGTNSEDDDDTMEVEFEPPSMREALNAVQCIRSFFAFNPDVGSNTSNSSLVDVENTIQEQLIKKRSLKQSILTDFFSTS